MKRHWNKKRKVRSSHSEIKRLEDSLRHTHDETERENLKQHIEHWVRTQNNHKQ